MPLKESYVIWNNKGGVGKSTLTFHMATQYARRNPTESVLVIDLCPQANVSMALLSTEAQYGSNHLSSLYNHKRTVSFYLQRSLESGPIVKAADFLTQVREYNNQVKENLFLLCGDMYLESVGRQLEYLRGVPVMPRYNSWFNITSSIREFIEGSPQRIDGVTGNQANWVVFIDTNPAFAVYTEIALAAARKLIIPINADDFSVEAVRAMLDLVYGIRQEDDETPEDFQAYRQHTFSHKAALYNLRLPKIHLLINNRTTTRNLRSAKAFSAMGEENLRVLYQAYNEHQQEGGCFSGQEGQRIHDIEAFKEQYFLDVQDFHTTAILCLHTGCPLGALSGKIEFLEADSTVKVDRTSVSNYLQCLDILVQKL